MNSFLILTVIKLTQMRLLRTSSDRKAWWRLGIAPPRSCLGLAATDPSRWVGSADIGHPSSRQWRAIQSKDLLWRWGFPKLEPSTKATSRPATLASGSSWWTKCDKGCSWPQARDELAGRTGRIASRTSGAFHLRGTSGPENLKLECHAH